MKTLNNNKMILLTCILFLSTICAYAYPPDNAAVLYFKTIMSYEVDDEMTDMLDDFRRDKIELNDKIRTFVDENRLTINSVLDASEVKNCDWGLDISQGWNMQMPQLGGMKNLARLIVADAKILAQDGHYELAINNCMSLYRMARHVNDRNLICYLVGTTINGMTNDCLIQIISEMPQHTRNMTRLKTDLMEIEGTPLSVKPALLGERDAMLACMLPENLTETLEQLGPDLGYCSGDNVDDSDAINFIKEKLNSDEAFLERSRDYYKNHIAGTMAACDMPYAKGFAAMEILNNKVTEDFDAENHDAIFTAVLSPPISKIFSLKTRSETYDNAIKAAIEVYLVKAKTGKLPDVLPANLPVDLFSGKPFEYEKTKDGFTLRCRAKEVGKDQPHEYKFKVSK